MECVLKLTSRALRKCPSQSAETLVRRPDTILAAPVARSAADAPHPVQSARVWLLQSQVLSALRDKTQASLTFGEEG